MWGRQEKESSTNVRITDKTILEPSLPFHGPCTVPCKLRHILVRTHLLCTASRVTRKKKDPRQTIKGFECRAKLATAKMSHARIRHQAGVYILLSESCRWWTLRRVVVKRGRSYGTIMPSTLNAVTLSYDAHCLKNVII